MTPPSRASPASARNFRDCRREHEAEGGPRWRRRSGTIALSQRAPPLSRRRRPLRARACSGRCAIRPTETTASSSDGTSASIGRRTASIRGAPRSRAARRRRRASRPPSRRKRGSEHSHTGRAGPCGPAAGGKEKTSRPRDANAGIRQNRARRLLSLRANRTATRSAAPRSVLVGVMLAEQLAVLRRQPRIALRRRWSTGLLRRQLRRLPSLHVALPRSVDGSARVGVRAARRLSPTRLRNHCPDTYFMELLPLRDEKASHSRAVRAAARGSFRREHIHLVALLAVNVEEVGPWVDRQAMSLRLGGNGSQQ